MTSSKEKVFILSAVRTPIGSFNGLLSSLKAHELGSQVIRESLSRASIASENVSEVIIGQVLTAGQGQNPARQASINAGVPYNVPAYSVNMVCGSGLRSVVLGWQSILCGDASIVVCGGQESMSQAPHAAFVRSGVKKGSLSLEDTMLSDGLTDAIHGYHMGITAENVAKQYGVTRSAQDQCALRSQQRAEAAMKAGHFCAEILPITVAGTRGSPPIVVAEDEYPRKGCTIESLERLKPCFIKDGSGSVTAGNSSGINDGAAAVVLASSAEVQSRQLSPMAEVVTWAQAALDPAVMGYGPVPAVKAALVKAKWSVDDVDLWELNEAFASQTVAVALALGVGVDKVNVCGGAIALGHPIGASGTRILVTLLHSLRRLGLKKGVASLCVGGGMGIAICVQTA